MNEQIKKEIRANIQRAINKAGSQQALVELMNRWVLKSEFGEPVFDQGNLSRALKKGHLPDNWVIPMEKVTGISRKKLHYLFMVK